MVFEAISTSLSNLGKDTVKTGKSMIKTTRKAGKVVTDPLTGVAKKSVKYIPFVGAEDDIWELSHDHYALELFQQEVRSAHTKLISSLRKEKIPASKLNLIKKSLGNILHTLDHEIHLNAGEAHVLDMTKQLAKAIKTSVANEYTNGSWISTKKIQLTATQQKKAQEQFLILQQTIKHSTLQLKNLTAYVTTKPSSSYQSKTALKTRRDKNHEYVDDLITAKFDIVTYQKKVYYLLLELERKVKKQASHKNTLSKTYINDIINIKIPAHLQIIKDLRATVASTSSQGDTNRASYDAGVQTWLQEVASWLDINKKQTKKLIAQEKKQSKQHDSQVNSARKSYITSSNMLISKTKEPYASPDLLQKTILKETQDYTQLNELLITRLSDEYAIYLSESKDTELAKMYIQEYINRSYDDVLLNKESSLHLSLLNRIHKKQAAAQEKISKQLKKLKTMQAVPALKKIHTWNAVQKKHIKAIITASDKKRQAYKKQIQATHADIKIWRTTNLYLTHISHHQGYTAQHNIKRSMMNYLTKDKKQLEGNISGQKKLIASVANTLKKSEIQLQENERSVFALQDAKRTKKAKDFEKVVHAQEISLDTLEHHLDHEKDLLFIVDSQMSTYTSDTKKLLKKQTKEQKMIKKYAKEIKKNAVAKKVMY